MTVQETDASPVASSCTNTLNVSNGTLTDNGDGTFTLTTGGGGGDSITVNTTAATDANFLDNIYIDWTLDTAPTPDDITAKLDYTQTLAGNPAFAAGEVAFTTSGTTGGVLFEGAADTIEGLLQWAPTTSDRTVTIQDATHTLVGRDTTDTLTNKTIDTTNTVTVDVTDVAAAASATWAGQVSDETGTGVWVFGTSPTITTSLTQDGDAGDAGYLRLQNAAQINWEASPAGTDVTMTADASEIIQITGGTLDGADLTANTVGPTQIDETPAYSWSGTHTYPSGTLSAGGAVAVILPTGTNPTVALAGRAAVDETDNQFLYGSSGSVRVIPDRRTVCAMIENLAAADDNMELYMSTDAITVVDVGCHCRGTCTTAANITLEDRTGAAMTHGTVTCSTSANRSSFFAVTGVNTLSAGNAIRFDVTNAVSPETDEYTICASYTVDRQ